MTQNNEPTILEMNRTICEFMGWEFKEDPKFQYMAYFEGNQMWCDNLHGVNKTILEGFAYHKDWSRLMPVIEKIETPQYDANGKFIYLTSADVQITYKACIIEYEPDEESGDPHEEVKIQTISETKIEAVHKAVYQFITWYNNQQNITNEQ